MIVNLRMDEVSVKGLDLDMSKKQGPYEANLTLWLTQEQAYALLLTVSEGVPAAKEDIKNISVRY